jgi:hypothetical protein
MTKHMNISVNAPDVLVAEAAVKLELDKQNIRFSFVHGVTAVDQKPDNQVAIVIVSPLAERPFTTYMVTVHR